MRKQLQAEDSGERAREMKGLFRCLCHAIAKKRRCGYCLFPFYYLPSER